MLERFWLILIFVLATIVPPMHAAQRSISQPMAGVSVCAAAGCAMRCSCDGCPCAQELPVEKPSERQPAVPPTQPERQQSAEPSFEFVDLVLEEWSGPQRIAPDAESPARYAGIASVESLLCVWRI